MYEALDLYLLQNAEIKVMYVDVKCVDLYEKLLNINLIYFFTTYTSNTANLYSNMKQLSDCDVRLGCSWIHYYITLVHVLFVILVSSAV